MGLCLLYGIADKMASFPKEILICQFPSQAIQKSSKKARRLAGPLSLVNGNYACAALAETAFLFAGQILYMIPSFATIEIGILGKSL